MTHNKFAHEPECPAKVYPKERKLMSDYTFSTDDVRETFYDAPGMQSPRYDGTEFDCWLAAHDAEVYQRGREDAANAVEAVEWWQGRVETHTGPQWGRHCDQDVAIAAARGEGAE